MALIRRLSTFLRRFYFEVSFNDPETCSPCGHCKVHRDEINRLGDQRDGLVQATRALSSRWRENDMTGVGIALARLEEAADLREQGSA